ncbi:exodeoxyribonuclease V subunit alpha [Marinobacter xestospongiae]|uniref:RecBCD enzyme subunit RecD n=1 Tax=Marinobacter xestospongiae TaxID=994319 RepID=A0ABU3VYU6_9GAMM|nr:exodeoxyribonuclease V subunit alpha [Marinobacter xestospongiae]MDV2079127.1 exodeoxyribonuclease V subunit alpha [Marinobacter xestospongiae]
MSDQRTDARAVLGQTESLMAVLEQWVALGWLRPLDSALARFLDDEARAAGQPASPLLLLAAALTSHQLGRGHVCLDLALMAREGFNDALSLPPEDDDNPHRHWLPSELLAGIGDRDWAQALDHPLLVSVDDQADGQRPLVHHGSRLYLKRYWDYEQGVFQQLATRLRPLATLEDPNGSGARVLAQALAALFPVTAAAVDWQRVACGNAARQGFSVITGGPGTGKTTTVVKLLAALQAVAIAGADGNAAGRALRIRLAAPTGKAAARLNESIAGAVSRLDLTGLPEGEAVRETIPSEVTTLHRLLGSIPGSRKFRHHRDNPLLVDVLVVDEASMVDLEMMARTLEALPTGGRLILLGDKDQLASVDAGAVLGELCQRARQAHYTPATVAWLQAVTGDRVDHSLVDDAGCRLDQAITLLRHSYRFDAASGIGQLARVVNDPEPGSPAMAQARRILDAGYADLAWVPLGQDTDERMARHCINGGAEQFPNDGQGRRQRDQPMPPPDGYRHYLEVMRDQQPAAEAGITAWDDWAAGVLAAYGRFQLLCALRRGPFGVEGLNPLIANGLRQAGLIRSAEGWFPGRPVLVTRNDYSLGLMNGDIGIALELPARQWVAGQERVDPAHLVTRVAFPAMDGGVRWVLPSRLQEVETVFAMTVHKSQGSEFEHTCLVLPDRLNPVLTRELVYTGITRARSWFSLLLPDQQVLAEALERRVTRTSGLGEWLLSASRLTDVRSGPASD